MAHDVLTHEERVTLLRDLCERAASGNTTAMLVLDQIDSLLFGEPDTDQCST